MKLTEKEGSVRFEVHAKPRAKRSHIMSVKEDGALQIALAAPPVDGAANEELVRLLSATLGIPRRNIEILRGETSQKKLIGVTGLTADEVRSRLVPR
jgi:uncharacterized protein (TIGR00251 family)